MKKQTMPAWALLVFLLLASHLLAAQFADFATGLPAEVRVSNDSLDRTPALVHVAIAPNEVIAGMWVDILEQNGIHALVKSGPLKAGLYAFNEPCEIQALKSQAEEAKQILKSLQEAGDEEKPDDKPNAGSE